MHPRQVAEEYARIIPLQLRYGVNLERLAALGVALIELGPDAALVDYLAGSAGARHGKFKTALHRTLRWFLSDFDINGLLGTYPMHVLSTQQFRELLGSDVGGRLLDIGAGRGDVTSQLAQLFEEVTVTETSKPMIKRLEKFGYRVWFGDFAERIAPPEQFDVVSLLNVLDRCDRPLGLLAAARAALQPGGKLILALVLPYRPFVYDHGSARAPRERLPLGDQGFESSVWELITLVLKPLGFQIESISRAPYLSGGDADHALYELDDLIVVCKAPFDVPILRT